MWNKIAQIISVIFQPLFVPTYALILLLSCPIFYFSPTYKLVLLSFFVACTCVVPLVCSLILYSPKSLTVLERTKRHIIYILTFISYVFCFYLMWKIRVPFALLVMYAGCVLAVFLLMVVNFFWKISAHSTVMGSLCGYIFLMEFYAQTNNVGLFVVVVLLLGIVGWARLQLNAHTVSQVFAGYALGLLPSVASFFLFV